MLYIVHFQAPPVPKHQSKPERPPAPPSRNSSQDQPEKPRLTAVDYERMYGIRVDNEEEHLDEDADKYKFDYEKPKVAQPEPPKPQPKLVDPFDDFFGAPSTNQPKPTPSANDLFSDWPSDSGNMHRNASAPNLDKKKFDPFAEFLAANGGPPDLKPSEPPRSANASGRSTPMRNQQNLQNKGFDAFFNAGMPSAPKFGDNAFDDLLNQQGFASSAKSSQRTLADLKRAEEIRDMDPEKLKVSICYECYRH